MADVKVSGPMFDGRAADALKRGIEQARKTVADNGARLAAAALTSSIRHQHSGRAVHGVTTTARSRAYQTGKYTLPVAAGPDETIVTTDLATYGPWLEGTGSRNDSTRFKGYHSFRLAGQELDRVAGHLAEVALAPYVREMN